MIQLSAPVHILNVSIKLSGSKSISNRLLILNRVLNLDTTFRNLSDSEDTQLLQNALREIKNKHTATIDIGHAGTDMRFLTAYLAVTKGEWTLTGSERMKQRPVGQLVKALRELGADITYLEKENYPPLLIRGKSLQGGSIAIESNISSQFVSALLLIAPVFEKGLDLILEGQTVSRPYIDMTIALLKQAGVKIQQAGDRIHVGYSSSAVKAREDLSHVESDWSSASYWYSLCALSGNNRFELTHLSIPSLQADSILPELYKDLGVKTTIKENSVILQAVKPLIKTFSYDFSQCPDIAQTLAVTCFGLGIPAHLTGLSTLKVKETDRITALKTELEKLGATVNAGEDFLLIKGHAAAGNQETHTISTYKDHRMAMSFAPLSLLYKTIRIQDPSVVNKSYPAFWEDLKSLGFSVNLQP